ncbi:MAG: hypothetical protein KF729_04125 [Sandaracinaceae bacterium]|nr:hypothetical protein [Sandaracinaceae bacterium]
MRLAAIGAAASAWLVPALALACPVCFDANEANRDAYVGTTVLLSLLPLAFVGAVVLVLRARARALEKAHETSPLGVAPAGEFSICNVPDDAR